MLKKWGKPKLPSNKLHNSTRQLAARLDSQLAVPNSARLDSHLVNSNSTRLAKFLSETIPRTDSLAFFPALCFLFGGKLFSPVFRSFPPAEQRKARKANLFFHLGRNEVPPVPVYCYAFNKLLFDRIFYVLASYLISGYPNYEFFDE